MLGPTWSRKPSPTVLRELLIFSMYRTNVRKILAPIKIKSALPPPPPPKNPKNPKYPPPLKRGILWTWRFSSRTDAFFQAPIKNRRSHFRPQNCGQKVYGHEDFSENGGGRSGGQTAKGDSKTFPRLKQPLFAVQALRELESASRVSILWDAVTVPTVCFSGLSEGRRGGQQQFATQTLRGHLLAARYRFSGVVIAS